MAKIRVLYVDDNAHDRALVRDALENESDGFAVTEASSRAEFEAALARGGYDLVLSDFNILGFTGLQVIEAVRAADPQAPVVIVTGTGSEETGVEAMKLGSSDYVIKSPRHIQRLPQTIMTVLEKRRLQQEREKVDAQLKESEALFHTLARAAPVGIFRTDAAGELNYMNQRCAEIAGYPAAKGLGRGWIKAVHPADRERVSAEWFAAVAAGSDFQSEFRYQHPDGAVRHVLGQAQPDRTEAGEVRGFVGTVTDLTERERDRRDLERQARIIDQIHDAVAEVDMDGIVRSWNKGSERMLGFTKEEMVGQPIERIYPKGMWQWRLQHVIEPVLRKGQHEVEVEHITKDGRSIWVHLSLSLLRDEAGKPVGTLGYSIDITERLRQQQELTYRAYHDELTGLENRRAMRDGLEVALMAARERGQRIGLVVLNLDRLHHVNDTLGYAVGDQVLVEASRRLRVLAAEDNCRVGRIAGDEFLLLTQPDGGVAAFERIAREAARLLGQPYAVGGAQTVYLTCSVGVSWSPEAGNDAAQLLGQADLALNIAKQQGRNRVVMYSAERSSDMAERIVVGAEMREALQRDEIRLHYQPLVDAQQGSIAGAEALMRWTNARLGSIGPSRFIPVAEDTGMIIRLGDYALRTAIAQLRAWDVEGRRAVPVSVNVSAWQFQRPEFIAEIEHALGDAGVAPGLLKLELTESTVMDDAQAAVQKMTRLKQLGVRISLDDFGTGYSSLGYLRKLPIDEVKIDQSFVRDIVSDSYAATLCRAIIAMSQQLHFTVVAEGVETPAQAQMLRDSGCQLLQGFLYSKAVAASDFGALLARGMRWLPDGRPST
jgi:diguanylate cyclase (GGDEF)-like protein/PAS domain S-box-containing protein